MQCGKLKRDRTISPSSSAAVKEALARAPHANLLPPDLEAIETARRAEILNGAKVLFNDGLLAHEILERYPAEHHWMAERIADLEVVFRREQIQFVENQNKPTPVFNAPKPSRRSAESNMVPLNKIAIDRPHLKAVAIKVELCHTKTGELTEEMVWFPRSQLKRGEVPAWLVKKKREELEAKHPKATISGLPK